MSNAPAHVEKGLAGWKALLETGDPSALDDILSEDAVMISPVVFTPQRGKDITKLYLAGAEQVLNNEHFRYVGEWLSESGAVLEFETKIGDIAVNGVDMITFDADGKITEFKVMVRPLKAINALHAAMGEMLERLKGA